MPRPRIDERWRNRIKVLLENNPRIRDSEIEKQLRREAVTRGGTENDAPSVRTIARVRHEFASARPTERAEYRYASWPESMESEALPWEASAALLDLRRYLADHPRLQVTVRVARWFWRATQAAPDAPFDNRLSVARLLAGHEGLGTIPPEKYRAAETSLMYRSWTPEGRRAYEEAVERGDIPATMPGWTLAVRPDVDVDRHIMVMADSTGQKPDVIRAQFEDVMRLMETAVEEEHDGE